MEKTAYLICGEGGAGTRLVTRILVSAGVYAPATDKDWHEQKISGEMRMKSPNPTFKMYDKIGYRFHHYGISALQGWSARV